MEIIKRKLQANKLDLENALDRADLVERQLKEHVQRADQAESEIASLARRITLLEEDLEKSEQRLQVTTEKLEAATQVADESERVRKMLEHRANTDEERVDTLEQTLRETRLLAEDSDRKYDEAARKLALLEVELDRVQERATVSEAKQAEQEEELKVVGNNLRSLELSEEQMLQQLQSYELALTVNRQRCHEAEARAEFAERTVQKLQKEIEHLEDSLSGEREKYKHISDELDQTFSELTAC